MATEASLINRMSQIKHKILVLSGKGGVGKSTVASQLALALLGAGKKVGILDIDICGPSVPKIFGLEGKEILQCSDGWVPVYANTDKTLSVMSIGFLLGNDPNQAVIWKGPKKTAMIRQFLASVFWGDLDYLVIDTPPGTSDEHLAVVEYLQKCDPDGAILVTTPQLVSVTDVRKEINFCKKTHLPIIGVIENMSGFACPCCNEVTNIFSSGGGEILATEYGLTFLGRVPIDPRLTQSMEEGKNLCQIFPNSPAAIAFNKILAPIIHTDDS